MRGGEGYDVIQALSVSVLWCSSSSVSAGLQNTEQAEGLAAAVEVVVVVFRGGGRCPRSPLGARIGGELSKLPNPQRISSVSPQLLSPETG